MLNSQQNYNAFATAENVQPLTAELGEQQNIIKGQSIAIQPTTRQMYARNTHDQLHEDGKEYMDTSGDYVLPPIFLAGDLSGPRVISRDAKYAVPKKPHRTRLQFLRHQLAAPNARRIQGKQRYQVEVGFLQQ